MTIIPPIATTREAALGAVEAEILAERAGALGRASRRFEAALAALKSDGGSDGRSALVAEARTAMWELVVTREAMGFRNSDELIPLYQIPAEVSAYVVPPRTRWYRQR